LRDHQAFLHNGLHYEAAECNPQRSDAQPSRVITCADRNKPARAWLLRASPECQTATPPTNVMNSRRFPSNMGFLQVGPNNDDHLQTDGGS
jgi:hypothetical protein